MKSTIVIILVTALLLAGIGVTPVAAQTSACGSTYVTQPGDYLFKIARQCGVTYASLLAANPQIANPSLIYPNQVINIPNGSVQAPVVSITPTTGTLGTVVTLSATGFGANKSVLVSFGLVGGTFSQLERVSTDANGALHKQYAVPSSTSVVPQDGSYKFRVVREDNTSISAYSNSISITRAGTSNPGTGSAFYEVKRGDNLSRIAAAFGTTVNAIMAINPAIKSNYVIYPGQIILIPTSATISPSGAFVSVSPTTAHPGDTIQVSAGNFPANADIDVRIAKQDQSYSSVVDAKANAQGMVSAQIKVPASAVAGEHWVVIVVTTESVNVVQGTSLLITIN